MIDPTQLPREVLEEKCRTHEDESEVSYKPSYSQEMNPDEYLSCDLKAGVHSGKMARSNARLKKKVISHMRMFQICPQRVAKYFIYQKIRYAA
jgi:hypothetical protein